MIVGKSNKSMSVLSRLLGLAVALCAFSAAGQAQFAIVANPASPPLGVRGVEYPGLGFTVSEIPAAPALNYRVTTNGLPPDLAIDPATGNITGIPTAAGTYTFRVSVDDSTVPTPATAESGDVSIVITNPPLGISTASPLPAGSNGSPYATNFQATGGDEITYNWTLFDGAMPPGLALASPANTATVAFGGTPSAPGVFNFSLQVDDGDPNTPPAIKAFSISIGPAPLTLSYPSPNVATRTVAFSTPLTPALGGGTAAFGYAVTFGSLPDGLTLNTATGAISGTPTEAGTFTFQVTVTDSGTPPQMATSGDIVIEVVNPPLQITTASTLAPATAGTAYTANVEAVGGDGAFSWTITGGALPPGLQLTNLSSAAVAITGIPERAGSFVVELSVADSDPDTSAPPKQFSVVVSPVISTLNPSFRTAGAADLILQISGFGFVANQTIVSFGDVQLGTGEVAITATPSNPATTAVLSVPGSALSTPGPVSVVVTTNGIPSNASTFTIIGDTTLTITNESNLGTQSVGTAFEVDLHATGGNGNYTWSVAPGTTLPAGLSLDANSGVLNGILGQSGNLSFTIRVVDDASPGQASGLKAFTLVVQDFLVSTTSLPQARVGLTYTAQLAVSGGPTAPLADYEWTLVGGASSLPAGLLFSAITGTITGIPGPIGSPSQDFTIQVTARHVATGIVTPTRSLQLSVAGGGLDISVNSLPVAIVNETYGAVGSLVKITPVNGTPPYVMELSPTSNNQLRAAGFIPSIVTNSANASLTLGGIPTISGTFTVDITVRDAGNTSVQRVLNLIVLANPLVIKPETLPAVTVDTDFTQQLTVDGLSAEEQNAQPGQPVVAWTLLNGISGLSLNPLTGVLSGRFPSSGQRQFSIRAVTNLRETIRQYSLTVETPRPTISTLSVPPSTVGQAYSAELSAIGGLPGYTWLVAGITLPKGLSFDAATVNSANLRISGTPEADAQTRSFTITVRDSVGQTDSRDFTLSVNTTPIPEISLQPFTNPVPAEQKEIRVSLAATYPFVLQGTATVSFTPDATNNANDPAVRLLNGERTARFTIPANSTEPVLVQQVQTGTVAGTIRVEAAIDGGPSTSREFSIARSAPFLQDNLAVQPTSGGFNVAIVGYSTPRDLSSAQVTFTPTPGTNLGTTQLSIPLTDAATQWFQGAEGQASGSTFRLTIPFTVTGGTNAVASVTVTLTNSVGTSNSRVQTVQ